MSFQDCTVQGLKWDAAIGVITGADILTPASSINTQNLPVTISASLFMPDIIVHSYYHLRLCRSAVAAALWLHLPHLLFTVSALKHNLDLSQSDIWISGRLNFISSKRARAKKKNPRQPPQYSPSVVITIWSFGSWVQSVLMICHWRLLSVRTPARCRMSRSPMRFRSNWSDRQSNSGSRKRRTRWEQDQHMRVFSSLPRISGCTHQLPDLSWYPLPLNSYLLFVTRCSTYYVINRRATPLQTEFTPSKWFSNWGKSTVTLVFCRHSLAGCWRRRWKRRGRDRSSWKPTLRRSTLRITEVGTPRLVYVLMNSCLQGNETRSCSLFLGLEFGFARVCFWCCLEPETVSEEKVIREASVC